MTKDEVQVLARITQVARQEHRRSVSEWSGNMRGHRATRFYDDLDPEYPVVEEECDECDAIVDTLAVLQVNGETSRTVVLGRYVDGRTIETEWEL
jgi:hypothetical protein